MSCAAASDPGMAGVRVNAAPRMAKRSPVRNRGTPIQLTLHPDWLCLPRVIQPGAFMAASTSTYTVGRGKPPLHTRFKKGQSGNPSGKPGPAKVARQRFQRVLYAALESGVEELEASKPENALAAMARQMALNAAQGRVAATRLVLTLLDGECEREAQADEESSERTVNEAEHFSLAQGKTQGKLKKRIDRILDALEADAAKREAQAEAGKRARLMMSSAAVPLTNKITFGMPPPGK